MHNDWLILPKTLAASHPAPPSSKLAKPMLTRLHYDECASQLGFAVGPEHPAQFRVRGGQSGWISTQQDNAFSETLHEYQAAEIFVACNENPPFLAGATQQGRVRSPGHAKLRGGD